jgi:mono/diheme cytochrome c family protein
MVAHDGTGRAFTDGTGSWVDLNEMGMHNSGNKSGHSSGYTLGNQHPDFSGGDMTQTQIDNLVEFLNFMDADQSAYFANIDPSQNPVLYTIVDTADAAAGEMFYNNNCMGCHGDPATDHDGGNQGHPDGGILAYLGNDGKFSEFSHKARWGIPGSSMSYASIGSPTSANIADTMLYLQKLGGTGFAITPGMSGTWWNGSARSGEGFLIDASFSATGDLIVAVSFYTFDSMGNQAWIIGFGQANGNEVALTFEIPDGAMWGADFDPDDVVHTAWGTGTFTFSSCGLGNIALVPNAEMLASGFTNLEYAIDRSLLVPGVSCPTPAN